MPPEEDLKEPETETEDVFGDAFDEFISSESGASAAEEENTDAEAKKEPDAGADQGDAEGADPEVEGEAAAEEEESSESDDSGADDEGSEGEGEADVRGHQSEDSSARGDGGDADEGNAVSGSRKVSSDVRESAERTGEDVLNRLADLMKDVKPAKATQPEAEEEEPAAEEAEQPELYTPEEQEFLAEYEKEWGDVFKGEALRRKAEYRDLLQYTFQEMAKVLAPIHQTVTTLAERQQYGDITEKTPDYEEIRDDVVAWVEDQPGYLQTAYKEVMKSGTSEEVNDLFARYKEAKGLTQQEEKPKPTKKKAEPSETAKKAAKSMAPVSTKRSAVLDEEDPDDFDGAFAKFAKAG